MPVGNLGYAKVRCEETLTDPDLVYSNGIANNFAVVQPAPIIMPMGEVNGRRSGRHPVKAIRIQ